MFACARFLNFFVIEKLSIVPFFSLLERLLSLCIFLFVGGIMLIFV